VLYKVSRVGSLVRQKLGEFPGDTSLRDRVTPREGPELTSTGDPESEQSALLLGREALNEDALKRRCDTD
jgi:hypothetical protein